MQNTTGDDGLVYAMMLDGQGGGRKIDWSDLERTPGPSGTIWLHFDYSHPKTKQWLIQHSQLPPLVRQLMMMGETRPRRLAMENGLFAVMRGINTNPGADPEDMVSIRVWIETNRIITSRRRYVASVRDMVNALEANNGPRHPGEFLALLTQRLAVRMTAIIEKLSVREESVEERMLDGKTEQVQSEISHIRWQSIQIKRYLLPQKELIYQLAEGSCELFNTDHRIVLHEVADQTQRYIEDLDSVRERAAVTQEEIASRLNVLINKRIYTLSVLGSIFLPLSFFTGLFGMNVGGKPGIEGPNSFWVITSVILVIAVAMVGVLRWRKWL